MGFAIPPVPTSIVNETNQEESNDGLLDQLQQMTLGATGETLPTSSTLPNDTNDMEFSSEEPEQAQTQLDLEQGVDETVATVQFTLDIPSGLSSEELLARSDMILKMLLPVINDAGLGDHAHPCYANGTTYRDYCLNAHASIVAVAFMDGVVSAAASPQKNRMEEQNEE